MGITSLFRRNTVSSSTESRGTDGAPTSARPQRARRVGGQTRAEIRTNRRARIRDLREKVELANLKRVLAYQRACNKADRNGLARPAYPELLTIDSIRPAEPVPQTSREPSDGSLMPMVAAALAAGVARMMSGEATRTTAPSPHVRPGGDPTRVV